MTSFWTTQMLEVNLLVFMNLLGALQLGLLVGYERSHHVQAAETGLKNTIRVWGFVVAEGSLNISAQQHKVTWQFVMVALRSHPDPNSLFDLSRGLKALSGVDSLHLSHACN